MIYLIYIGILSIGGNKGSPFLHKDLAVFYPVSTFTCAKSHSQWYKSDRQTVKKKMQQILDKKAALLMTVYTWFSFPQCIKVIPLINV